MKKSVALVLSSGGARGLAQIGVIQELERQGFEITSVSGASIGSWIGGMYAMGELNHFTEWICSLSRFEIFNLMGFTVSTQGLLNTDRAFRKLENEIPDVLIEDLRIPYVAMATDIVNKKEVAFTSGSLYKAIRASIAIPAIITSVQEDDRVLVDGGVLNPIPIKQIQRTPGDILVVVNLYGIDDVMEVEQKLCDKTKLGGVLYSVIDRFKVTSENIISFAAVNKQSPNYISIVKETIGVILQNNIDNALEMYKPDITIHIPSSSAKSFDFHKAEDLIEIGREEAKKNIALFDQIQQSASFPNTF